MYLVTVEGGDGSGKGEAVRILRKIASEEFAFSGVHLTHEPRRNSRLGMLAINAVRKGDHTPMEEAGLFAADRIDHSRSWIEPILEEGGLVISDRNIHSSLVYQGVVGNLGLERVAQMNSAALIPDLVIWIDCDPEQAMRRINSGTLRAISLSKKEYFETTEIQKKIRKGFSDLLSGEIKVPPPFNSSLIVGPIKNEKSLDELEQALKSELRSFVQSRPHPLNSDPSSVDLELVKRLIDGVESQSTLPGLEQPTHVTSESFLDGLSPSQWFDKAEMSWDSKLARKQNVSSTPVNFSVSSIVGTLSFIGTTDVARMRRRLGPVRFVTARHSRRILKWLEESRWVNRQQLHVPFHDGASFRLRAEWIGFGKIILALLPLIQSLNSWRKKNKTSDWSTAMADIVTHAKKNEELSSAVDTVISRLELIGSGHPNNGTPDTHSSLVSWWNLSG
ncbi:MAG: dTMP kinase [Methanobacteriota archaeon]|nr:MAG: dTMP kinase [Euryarchaeota archaeon]|tara:strand:- start:114 stop:1457 length:1344 start_codon:yes stop_codon:yes gene_type:complete